MIDRNRMSVAVQSPAAFQNTVEYRFTTDGKTFRQNAVMCVCGGWIIFALVRIGSEKSVECTFVVNFPIVGIVFPPRRQIVARCAVLILDHRRRSAACALAARDLFGRERVLRARIENRRKDARKRHRQNGDRRDQFCPCRRMCHNFPFPFPFMFRRSRPMSSSLRPRAP